MGGFLSRGEKRPVCPSCHRKFPKNGAIRHGDCSCAYELPSEVVKAPNGCQPPQSFNCSVTFSPYVFRRWRFEDWLTYVVLPLFALSDAIALCLSALNFLMRMETSVMSFTKKFQRGSIGNPYWCESNMGWSHRYLSEWILLEFVLLMRLLWSELL